MKRFITLFFFIVILLATLLSGCGNGNQRTETNQTEQEFVAIDYEQKATPTPIPNLRAEAALDKAFSSYVARAVDYDPLITVDELIELQKQGDVYLVDLRNPLAIKREGSIPGAVSIPLRELGQKSSVLPDFEIPIVTYCEHELQCTIAQAGMGVYGWDIKTLKGGLQSWAEEGNAIERDKIVIPEVDPLKPAFPCCGISTPSRDTQDNLKLNIDPPDPSLIAAVNRMFDRIQANFGEITAAELAQELEQNPDLTLIDLRPVDVLAAEGEIKTQNQIQIPFEKLIEYKSKWPANKETPIIVYDEGGKNSSIAMIILWVYGYRDVRMLSGGFDTWSG